ncbi:unnamed protein product [Symbiodinium microadriaticum]|nr:unnamed protein product [Symbiodinium microadriaticum]
MESCLSPSKLWTRWNMRLRIYTPMVAVTRTVLLLRTLRWRRGSWRRLTARVSSTMHPTGLQMDLDLASALKSVSRLRV